MSVPRLIEGKKRRVAISSLVEKQSDLEIAEFLKFFRSFVFKIRSELKVVKFDTSYRKRHCHPYDVIKKPILVIRVDEISRKSMRILAKKLQVVEVTI